MHTHEQPAGLIPDRLRSLAYLIASELFGFAACRIRRTQHRGQAPNLPNPVRGCHYEVALTIAPVPGRNVTLIVFASPTVPESGV